MSPSLVVGRRSRSGPLSLVLVPPAVFVSVSHIIQTWSPKRDGCYCPISPLHFQTGSDVMVEAGHRLIGRREAKGRL